MSVNRGKSFESVIHEAFESVPNVTILRMHDQTMGFSGGANICDFVGYKKPFFYLIECKSVHGNTLSIHSNPKPDKRGVLHGFYGDITDKQWEGLMVESQNEGILAGILCWWVDKDVTKFIPIQNLVRYRDTGAKSVRFDTEFTTLHDLIKGELYEPIVLDGKKKRVFFDYDISKFFKEAESLLRGDKYDL